MQASSACQFIVSRLVLRMTLNEALRTGLAAILIACLISGCADEVGPPPPGFAVQDGPNALGHSYRIGVSDKLKLTVFGEENLSGPVEVNALGQVSLPLAGDVPAQGLTLAQFRDAVRRKLSEGYLNNPRVTVEITGYRPIYVHGEVKGGGEYPYKASLTLRDAVALAGGYTYRANQNYVFVAREGQPEVKLGTRANVPIMPGDNIRIPERFF